MNDSESRATRAAPIDRPQRRPGRGLSQRSGLARPGDLGEHLLRRPCRRRHERSARRSRRPGRRRGRCPPRLPDREGFGRREQSATAAEVEQLILEQVADLRSWPTRRRASPVPQAARGLYNQAQRGRDRPRSRRRGGRAGPPAPGTAGHALERWLASRASATSPRASPTAVIATMARSSPAASRGVILDPDELEAQLMRLLAEGRVATLCIHGDDPPPSSNADRIRGVLAARHRAPELHGRLTGEAGRGVWLCFMALMPFAILYTLVRKKLSQKMFGFVWHRPKLALRSLDTVQ